MQGCVVDSLGLALDGSYDHQYDFLFPRDGNLLQKVLTSFGIWNFNPSFEGHITGRIDYAYTNDELGFSADFPTTPKAESFSIGNDVSTTSFKGVKSTGFTYVEYQDFSSVSQNGISATDFFAIEQEKKNEILASMVEMYLEQYSGQDGIELDFDYSERQGYPSVKTFVPVTDRNYNRTDWYYGTSIIKDNELYVIVGARGTEEQARQAEASFVLLDGDKNEDVFNHEATASAPKAPEGAIDWREAAQHVGKTVTICGPVAGSTYADESNGQPTYIDLGISYPDTSRVSMVVWGEDRGSFSEPPEDMYLGRTVCVTGEVYIYGGACNVKVQSPSQIQLVG